MQFGFRKGHSTEHAILKTIENLKTAIDENKITSELSKASVMISSVINCGILPF
jgi:retron-type reverse transcriptase